MLRLLCTSWLCVSITLAGLAQSKGGRWQFEGNGEDTADWDRIADHGSLQGMASFTGPVDRMEGNGYLWLDTLAVHDFFLVNDSEDLDFVDENVGISAWVHPLRINDVHYLVIKGRQDSKPKTTNYALRIAPDGKLEFLIRDAKDQAQKVTSSFVVPVGKWSFVAAYYEFSAGKVYMWNDPAKPPVDTLDFAEKLIPNDDPLSIGTWFRGDVTSPSIKDFDGAVDDVRISGRVEDILSGATGLSRRNEGFHPISEAILWSYPNPVTIRDGKVRFGAGRRLRSVSVDNPRICIYDALGREVLRAASQGVESSVTFCWDLRNAQGERVPPGLYFVRIYAEDGLEYLGKVIVLP
jgi:hypothetical protein